MKLLARILAVFRAPRPAAPAPRRALSATSAEMSDLGRQIEREISRQTRDEGRSGGKREVRRG
ncbi:hypothetical protein WHT83_14880 [Aminobacter sp. P9b]|uniref:hypothetical protein n=1 Tax=Aminobacter sp. P9b TaxID=3133697 RepID=UPI00324649D0